MHSSFDVLLKQTVLEWGVKKIVIIGPESTGKSSLAQALAKHYQSHWVDEYARAYLTEYGTDYGFADLLTIAQGQLALEDQAIGRAQQSGVPYLFLDTDMHVMHVWSTFVFGKEHGLIERERAVRQYDMYLLACPDLPWTRDHLREYPDLETRDRLYHIYKLILQNQSTPWAEVYGVGDVRTQCAIDAIERL